MEDGKLKPVQPLVRRLNKETATSQSLVIPLSTCFLKVKVSPFLKPCYYNYLTNNIFFAALQFHDLCDFEQYSLTLGAMNINLS